MQVPVTKVDTQEYAGACESWLTRKHVQVPVAKVDMLRLSKVARRNLESDPDDPENEAASPGEAPDDVWLHTADAELDFAEGPPEGAGEGRVSKLLKPEP